MVKVEPTIISYNHIDKETPRRHTKWSSDLESIVDFGFDDGFVDEAFVDDEGVGIDVGEESSGHFHRILGILVKEETIVNADLAWKRVGNLMERFSTLERETELSLRQSFEKI